MLIRNLQVIDGAAAPITDWYRHSAEIANLPPMNSIQQFGASDISTLTFCRTAMITRDLFGGCDTMDSNAWYLQSWGEAVNDDLHRVLDVVALLPAHVKQSDRIALNPYDEAAKYDFEQQGKHLSALVQGLFTSQMARGDFAPWVVRPYDNFNSCADSSRPCMTVSACQRLAYIWLAQLMLFTANEKVRCAMPLTPESMNQSIEGDIEWLMMLEILSNLRHAISHCTAVDNSLVGMQTLITPLRVVSQFATSYQLRDAQDWCRHIIQALVDRNCQIAPWSILTAQTIAAL